MAFSAAEVTGFTRPVPASVVALAVKIVPNPEDPLLLSALAVVIVTAVASLKSDVPTLVT